MPDAVPRQRALAFPCQGAWLYGVLDLPEAAQAPHARGVLIVVGGPQYRAGSHRQFTLLARDLAAAGIPAMRFDYRGMGDSEGDLQTFENVDEDLRAAIDRFFIEVPGMREVVLWGLCDGASAASLYAPQDPRVSGLVLLNPWVRTEEGQARATIRHYYKDRLFDARLWKKVASGQFDVKGSVRSLYENVGKAFASKPARVPGAGAAPASDAALPERMQAALLAHRLHGERQADIAQRLQVSLNTVERDLMQADACLEAALLRWRGGVEAGLQASSRKRRRLANIFRPLVRLTLLTHRHRCHALMHAKSNREVRGQSHLLLTLYEDLRATL